MPPSDWQTVVGLEVHVHLKTRTKMQDLAERLRPGLGDPRAPRARPRSASHSDASASSPRGAAFSTSSRTSTIETRGSSGGWPLDQPQLALAGLELELHIAYEDSGGAVEPRAGARRRRARPRAPTQPAGSCETVRHARQPLSGAGSKPIARSRA